MAASGRGLLHSRCEVDRLPPSRARQRPGSTHDHRGTSGARISTGRGGSHVLSGHARAGSVDRYPTSGAPAAGHAAAECVHGTDHRVTLVERVAAILDRAGARYAVIGAAAMAVHGVARSTRDIDLLTLSADCIDGTRWERLSDSGVNVSVARGDADDPLAGVIRFDQAGQRPVDLVVGRYRWQQRLLERAEAAVSGGTLLPTALARDIVLLKLFASASRTSAATSRTFQPRAGSSGDGSSPRLRRVGGPCDSGATQADRARHATRKSSTRGSAKMSLLPMGRRRTMPSSVVLRLSAT